ATAARVVTPLRRFAARRDPACAGLIAWAGSPTLAHPSTTPEKSKMSPMQACTTLVVLAALAVPPVVHGAGGVATSVPLRAASPGQPDVSRELADAQRMIDQKDW